MNKAKSIAILAGVLVVALLGSLVAVYGIPGLGVNPVAQSISLGLDLRGGVYAVYVAQDPEQENFEGLLQSTISVLRNRLTAQGFTEATVTRQGTDRIRVEIPDVSDPQEILNIIGTPAHLQFLDEEGNVVLEGDQIKTAHAAYEGSSTVPVVAFELTSQGAADFAQATADNIGRVIYIELDGQLISAPVVEESITGGQGYISGMTDVEQAQELAMLILSGALPLEITQDEVSAISATLGVEALQTSLLAGIIGLGLVMLFMAACYRVPGLVADLALWVYVLIVVYALSVAKVQLTLPGIAGILLGIGMAVDANVIIFERFREELHQGCRLEVAVRRGFKNAITAVIDSNVTTIIAALVLMYFGTGSIKGFAITLFIGVVASMFTAVFVSRWLLTCAVSLSGGHNLAPYTRPYRERPADGRFAKHTRLFAGLSAIVLAAAVVLTCCGAGMNLGIEFTGGSLLTYEIGQPYQMADVESALQELGISEYQLAKAGDGQDPTQLQIRLKLRDDSDQLHMQLEDSLKAIYPECSYQDLTYVGPVSGQDLIDNAVKSLLIAFACMLAYIAWRFTLLSGLAALAALLHDVLIMCAFMAFFRGLFQVNSSFIAALLTIVGYSINNTIVIFDRIRELNKFPLHANQSRLTTVDLAVSSTLSHTLNTTITTLLPLICLLVLGVSSIQEFAFPLLVGMLAGTYSSVLLSGQFWAWLTDKAAKRKAAKG